MIQTVEKRASILAHNHLAALRASSRLTQIHRDMYCREAAAVRPEKVIRVLHAAGVNCVLMGTHGIGGWRKQARATEDVDVLVRKKDIRKAVRALSAAYPKLKIKETVVVTRFIDPATEEPVIDVLKPAQPVYQMVFRYTIAVGETHRIPDLEMALASKFAAMTSPHRRPDKKLIDAGDFVNVVMRNRASIDMRKLRRLADKVYPNGGAEILQLVNDIDAGRQIKL